MWALRSAQRLTKSVLVEWEDGLSASFTYVWLRDNGRRRPSLLHLDLNPRPEQLDYSRQQLSVIWPPFINSEYSSQFLRHHCTAKSHERCDGAVSKKVMKMPWTLIPSIGNGNDFQHMGSVEWGESAHELGTMWCHLRKVPSMYSVQSASGAARLNVVNVVKAVELLQVRSPESFAFLTSNFVEYCEGPFHARHRIATILDGKIVSVVFNNETRSSEITVERLDMLYSSLKQLNQICCDLAVTVQIVPGQSLVVDNAQSLIGAPPQIGRRVFFKLYS